MMKQHETLNLQYSLQVGSYICSTTCDVCNLEPGEENEFRVMAENSHGLGEPLLKSKPILTVRKSILPGCGSQACDW